MKDHLKFHLDSLKPWDVTEKMDKEETAQWAFFEGYKYRKTLELLHAYRVEKVGELKSPWQKIPVTSEVNPLLPLGWIQHTLDKNENQDTLNKLLGKFPVSVGYDEAAHIPPEKWDEINNTIKKMGKAARAVVDNIAEESGIDKNLIYHKCGSLKLSGDNHTCPLCLFNPAVEKVFNQNEISMNLYDAKFKGVIDEEQLFKLLDYFEGKENDKDKST